MRKPTFVYQFVLSIVLASCTKAEFEKIVTDAGVPDGSGDILADVAPLELQCEDKSKTVCVQPYPNTASSVACPDLCHMTAEPVKPGVVCASGAASDNCEKGNVCLQETSGVSTALCFTLCIQAKDCGNGAACAARFMSKDTWVKVCDLQYDSCSTLTGCCDPLTPPFSGKCGNNMVCYLVAPLNTLSKDSRTVCEYASGDGKADAFCGSSRECVPGYACFFPSTSPDLGTCKQVCDPKDPNACQNSGCTGYNTKYGVCM